MTSPHIVRPEDRPRRALLLAERGRLQDEVRPLHEAQAVRSEPQIAARIRQIDQRLAQIKSEMREISARSGDPCAAAALRPQRTPLRRTEAAAPTIDSREINRKARLDEALRKVARAARRWCFAEDLDDEAVEDRLADAVTELEQIVPASFWDSA